MNADGLATVITGYISIVRNADIFIKSYKSNISESQKSAFLKYRHMAGRNRILSIEWSVKCRKSVSQKLSGVMYPSG